MPSDLGSDFRDLLRVFIDREVRFLVVGGYAVAVHGRPRATGDLDVWIDCTDENAGLAFAALADFGAPMTDLTREDLATPGVVFQIGQPPLRIDVLTRLTGVGFESAWENRSHADFEGIQVPVIGRADLITNKRALGRARDLADVEDLEG